MNNGAVVVADEHNRPAAFSRIEAMQIAIQAGPEWAIEVMKTAPKYYVIRETTRPNVAWNRGNPI
jgi:hypothetical protein